MSTIAADLTLRTSSEAARPQWAAVWSLSIVIAALNASELLPASLLTRMSASLEVSEGLIGQSVTATAILAIITSLVIAPLSQRVNRRLLLIVFGVLLVVSNVIVAMSPNATILLAARLILGATVGGVWGMAPSLALRLVPSEYVPRAMSIIFGGATVAMIAAAPLGAYYGEIIGWRGVFLVIAGLSALAVLGLLFAFPPMPLLSSGKGTGMKHTLRLPWLVPGLLGVMLFWGGAQSFNTYIRPFLESVAGLSPNGVSLVLLLVGIASFIGTLIAAPLMSWSFRIMLPTAAAAEAILLGFLLLSGGSEWAAYSLPALWAVFVGTAGVGWSTWIARTFPNHAEPAGGMLVAAIQGSMMLGALLGGALIDTIDASAPLAASVIVLAVAAIYVGIIMRLSVPSVQSYERSVA